jgi:hypothetical protein
MMNASWMLWMIFILLFLVSPIGYGWGYRKWGPPYPRYIQRRRGIRAASCGRVINPYPSGVGMGRRLRVGHGLCRAAVGCRDTLVALI